MPRIGEAGAQHALVAGDRSPRRRPSASILATKANHGAAAPSGVAEREVALVDPHRDLHDLRRQVHVARRRCGRAAAPAIRPARRPRPAGRDRRPRAICRSAASAAMPSAMTPLALGRHRPARGARAASPPSRRATATAKAPGAMEAMPLGQVGRDQPVAVVGAVAQIERHHRAVQQADDAPQRAHPDERRWCRPSASISARGTGAAAPGMRAGDQLGGGDRGGRFLQHPVVAFLAQLLARRAVLAQETRPAPAPARWRAGRVRWCWRRRPRAATSARQRDAARAVEGRDVGRATAAPAPRRPAAPGPPPRRACMRAGISSLNSSRKNSGMFSLSAPARCRFAQNRCP